MSGGVSVLCWLAAPVAMFYGNLQKLVKSTAWLTERAVNVNDKANIVQKATATIEYIVLRNESYLHRVILI